jgi:hypothetical protein
VSSPMSAVHAAADINASAPSQLLRTMVFLLFLSNVEIEIDNGRYASGRNCGGTLR